MNEIIKFLKEVDGGIVLDAATGRGDFITTMKQHLKSYIQIIGIDFSEKSVEYASKFFPENDVEIYRMNLEDIQFANDYFDLVTISSSLHHLQNPDKVFAELLRVLKPGGTLLVAEMYCDGNQTQAQQSHIMLHHWLAGVDRLYGIHHQSTFTRAQLEAIYADIPLSNKQITDFYIPVDDPNRNCQSLMRNCKETMKRLETIPDTEKLLAEGQLLIQRIQETGCAGASRLLMTGTK